MDRVHQLFSALMAPSNWRVNQAVETNLQFFDPNSVTDPTGVEIIDLGEYATVLFTPSALGILNCGKMLPLRLSDGVSIELTLCDAVEAVLPGARQATSFRR